VAILGGRPDTRAISPHLIVRGGAAAIDFYKRAFGAEELYRSEMPGGLGIHAQLRIADSVVLVTDENLHRHPNSDHGSPQPVGGVCVMLELYVDDMDVWYQRALAAGATATMPPSDTFFGDRYGWVTDPFGHIWSLATVKEVVTPEQVTQRLRDYSEQSAHP
jgi:PhnB protein